MTTTPMSAPSDYPPLPEPAHSQWVDYGDRGAYDEKTGAFTADQMYAFVDADRTLRADQLEKDNHDLRLHVQRLTAQRDSLADQVDPICPADRTLRAGQSAGFNVRQMIEGAWCAGYYEAGYTNDSGFAEKKSSEYADDQLRAST